MISAVLSPGVCVCVCARARVEEGCLQRAHTARYILDVSCKLPEGLGGIGLRRAQGFQVLKAWRKFAGAVDFVYMHTN